MQNRIEELRIACNMSVRDLSEAIGTSRGQIYNLQSGERRLNSDWMKRIAKALDCKPSDLLLDDSINDEGELSFGCSRTYIRKDGSKQETIVLDSWPIEYGLFRDIILMVQQCIQKRGEELTIEEEKEVVSNLYKTALNEKLKTGKSTLNESVAEWLISKELNERKTSSTVKAANNLRKRRSVAA